MEKRIAIIFPGQGSQRLGMAKDFVAEFAESREIFEIASNCMGFDMQEVCCNDQSRLNQTEFMQPAILTAELAMLAVISAELSNRPAYFAGHSLGEYTALVAAEVLTIQDAMSIVRGRGSLMQNAVPEGSGTMAALIYEGINRICIEQIVRGSGAELANYNSANQVVISGPNSAVDTACARLQSEFSRMRIVRLDVQLPFHSRFMRSVEPELEKFLRIFEPRMNLGRAERVVSNLSGEFHKAEVLIENLVGQISGCVQWRKCMETLLGCTNEIIEIGPNRVLGRFFKDSGVTIHSIINLRSWHKYMESKANRSGG